MKTYDTYKLKEHRRAIDISAAQLARAVGCSAGYIYQVESGLRPSETMCAAIGESIRELGERRIDLVLDVLMGR